MSHFLDRLTHFSLPKETFSGDHGLTTVLSLNFLAEHGLATGSALALRLLPERIRLFDQ